MQQTNGNRFSFIVERQKLLNQLAEFRSASGKMDGLRQELEKLRQEILLAQQDSMLLKAKMEIMLEEFESYVILGEPRKHE
jgi:hypothetical protein